METPSPGSVVRRVGSLASFVPKSCFWENAELELDWGWVANYSSPANFVSVDNHFIRKVSLVVETGDKH